MTPGKKQAFEPTGLIPRSIVRTFERFYKQLLPKTKYSAIREYRISRYQVLVSIRCLCTLLILPLVTRLIANWLIFPQIQYFWDVTYQDEHVFSEIDQFSQVIFFDSLLDRGLLANNKMSSSLFQPIGVNETKKTTHNQSEAQSSNLAALEAPRLEQRAYSYATSVVLPSVGELKVPTQALEYSPHREVRSEIENKFVAQLETKWDKPLVLAELQQDFSLSDRPKRVISDYLEHDNTENLKTKLTQDQALQEKIFELAQSSHCHALQSLTNVFADLLSIVVLIFLLITLKPEITILKSFLVEVIYNLSDTTKSFLLILMTDLLVGFHSPRGWETMFSLILYHFGLPENQDFVFLFVATLPVILDTVFKYWIFRHLNKISPSTVATYHNMIE